MATNDNTEQRVLRIVDAPDGAGVFHRTVVYEDAPIEQVHADTVDPRPQDESEDN